MKTEINPTVNYVRDSIRLPYILSRYLKNKPFREVTRKRQKPEVVQNINRLKRKEKSIYKPSDMWTEEDDLIFCRYCPSKRDKAYHMIARDTSARPHEILRLKIKSVIWNRTPDGKIYANVLVNGKR